MTAPAVALEAQCLQNGYARAIDTREWDYFRTLFTSDVVAEYPNDCFEGIDEWLNYFVPFHDECAWIQHVMTNHVVGEDVDGIWGWCYGDVAWTHQDRPGLVNKAKTVYWDRLRDQHGTLRIYRRQCHLIASQFDIPIPESLCFPNSVLGLSRAAQSGMKGTN